MVIPEHLSAASRLVLALFSMGFSAPREIATLAGYHGSSRAPFVRFTEYILAVSHPVVMDCRKWGLPVACGVLLPGGTSMTCPQCRSTITTVPCVSCGRQTLCDQEDDSDDNAPLVEPLFPTMAEPGSAEKVRIMAERISRGESAFHPSDKVRRVDKVGWAASMCEPVFEIDYPKDAFCDKLSQPAREAA